MAQSKKSRSSSGRKYQQAIRAIKTRGKISHRVAQQVYRSRRDALGPVIPAARFSKYSRSYFNGLVRDARKIPHISVTIPSEKPTPKLRRNEIELLGVEIGEQVAFDLENISEGAEINNKLEDVRSIEKMKVVVEGFVGGKSTGSKVVERELVDKFDFWRAYYSMVREGLDKLYEKHGKEAAIAIVVRQITII